MRIILDIPAGLTTNEELIPILNDRLRQIGESLGTVQAAFTNSLGTVQSAIVRTNAAVAAVGLSSTPLGDVTLGTPLLRYLNTGQVQITCPVTAPSPLNDFDHYTAFLFAPDDSDKKAVIGATSGFIVGSAADASSLVPPTDPQIFGPFTYNSQEAILTITTDPPTADQPWRVYVTSGSATTENPLVKADRPSPTPSFLITVGPQPAGVNGAEFCPNARNVTGTLIYPPVEIGADQFWQFKLAWDAPTEDPRWPLVDVWDIVLYDPARTDDPATPQDERFPLVSGEPASALVFALQDKWKIPDTPVSYNVYIVPRKANGDRNTIVDGVTASFQFTPVRQGAMGNVTGFSVTSAYSTPDNDGYRNLELTPIFTKPTDAAFAYIEFWAQRPENSAWYLLGYPGESGPDGKATIAQLPTAILTWNFLAVAQDANDRDRDGNVTTDPLSPPAGTPAFALSIPPPDLGPAGAEYTGLVTAYSIGATYPATADGTYNANVTAAFTPPAGDKTWGGAELFSFDGASYVSRAKGSASPLVSVIPVPQSSTAWTWYIRSFDMNGRMNTIQPASTPSAVILIGSAPGKADGSRLINFSVSTVKLDTTEIQVGGGGSKPGKFGVYNIAGVNIGFIGVSGSDEGGWFKTLGVGGSSFASAQLKADSSGNVTLTGSVSITSGTVTIAIDASNKIKLTDTSISSYAQINGGFIDLAPTFGSGSCRVGRDAITFATSLNGTNYLVINGSSTPSIALYPGAGILRTYLDSNGQIFLYNAAGTQVFRADQLGWVDASNGFSRNGVHGMTDFIPYAKVGGGSGQLTFTGGILTAWF